MKLTQEQIEEIRKRAEDATPGPWKVGVDGYVCNAGFYVTDTIVEDITSNIFEKEDAEFIANARQDIPALLAHIAELERINFNIIHTQAKRMGEYATMLPYHREDFCEDAEERRLEAHYNEVNWSEILSKQDSEEAQRKRNEALELLRKVSERRRCE